MPQMSQVLKERAIGMLTAGMSTREVARELNVYFSTISHLIETLGFQNPFILVWMSNLSRLYTTWMWIILFLQCGKGLERTIICCLIEKTCLYCTCLSLFDLNHRLQSTSYQTSFQHYQTMLCCGKCNYCSFYNQLYNAECICLTHQCIFNLINFTDVANK